MRGIGPSVRGIGLKNRSATAMNRSVAMTVRGACFLIWLFGIGLARGYVSWHSVVPSIRTAVGTPTNSIHISTYNTIRKHKYISSPRGSKNMMALYAGRRIAIDWIRVLGRIGSMLEILENMKENLYIDFTAGAGAISASEMYQPILDGKPYFPLIKNSTIAGQPPVLVVHQLGKKVVKTLPDSALLGVLVLIASELLQREVNTNSLKLPPVLQDIANTTIFELDSKLQFLSSLQWNMDPFLQAELENLQNQPLEVIDKYIVKEFLPKIDKELSPLLSSMVTDPEKVKLITNNVKDLIKIGRKILLTDKIPSTSMAQRTTVFIEQMTDQVNEQVDYVGESVQEAIKDWNKIITDLNKLVKAESIYKLLPQSLFTRGTALDAASAASIDEQNQQNKQQAENKRNLL